MKTPEKKNSMTISSQIFPNSTVEGREGEEKGKREKGRGKVEGVAIWLTCVKNLAGLHTNVPWSLPLSTVEHLEICHTCNDALQQFVSDCVQRERGCVN